MLEFVPATDGTIYHVFINGEECAYGMQSEQIHNVLNDTIANRVRFSLENVTENTNQLPLYTFLNFGRPLIANPGLLVIRFEIAPDHVVLRLRR